MAKRSDEKMLRLVIEDIVKRRDLMMEAHLQTGHCGRDTTY